MNLFESELQLAHDGDSADYELMLDIMYYMTHYSDALHHPKEDIVFARIKSRDASASATIEELTTQHTQLREMDQAIVRVLDDVVNGSITSCDRMEANGTCLRGGISDRRV